MKKLQFSPKLNGLLITKMHHSLITRDANTYYYMSIFHNDESNVFDWKYMKKKKNERHMYVLLLFDDKFSMSSVLYALHEILVPDKQFWIIFSKFLSHNLYNISMHEFYSKINLFWFSALCVSHYDKWYEKFDVIQIKRIFSIDKTMVIALWFKTLTCMKFLYVNYGKQTVAMISATMLRLLMMRSLNEVEMVRYLL